MHLMYFSFLLFLKYTTQNKTGTRNEYATENITHKVAAKEWMIQSNRIYANLPSHTALQILIL